MDKPGFQPSSQRGGAPRPRTLAEVRLALSTLPLYQVLLSPPAMGRAASPGAPDHAAIARLLLPLAGHDRVARILDGLQREGVGVVATCARELAELYASELQRLGLPCSITPL